MGWEGKRDEGFEQMGKGGDEEGGKEAIGREESFRAEEGGRDA